eukprot:7927160-Ditylum_brightwellii.AAC.1
MSQPVLINGPVHTVCKVIHNVMVSVAKADIGALFSNTCEGEELRTALQEMGQPHSPAPVMTDNSTVCGIINNAVKQQHMCAIDMRFSWMCNRCAQKYFIVYWAPGKYNTGDYHTKHHTGAHHQHIRPMYLHVEKPVAYVTELNCLNGLQGCVETDRVQTT